MALTPLSQAIYKGLDPGVYQPLQQLETGDALTQAGMDASPTSKWGALGRVAQALSGSYLTNTSRSKLADTIAGGKKQAMEDLMAALQPQAAVPSGLPQSAAPRSMAQAPVGRPQPAVQPAPPEGSPAAIVADRFPAEWSPPSANEQVAERFPAEWSPQTASAPPDAGPVAAIDKATQPRGIRNNNPLNIEDGPFAKSMPGYVGSDGRFAKFETQDHGLGAANTLLDSYDKKHGLNTVSGIINRWAPASDGNNVSAYAADVSKRLGIDPNAPVPKEMRQALIEAMGQHENGVPVKAPQAAVASDADGALSAKPVRLAQAAAATASDAGGGLDAHRLLAVLNNPYADDTAKALAGKLLLKQLEPKEDEFASSPEGIYNKRTGELKRPVTAEQQTVTGPDGKKIPIPEGVNPKKFRDEVTTQTANAAAGKFTEEQGKALQFAKRMDHAEGNLKNLEGQGTSFKGNTLNSVPLGNYLQSEDYQKYRQAQQEFITALLRRESGAAIAPHEFENYGKQFFPQPGDTTDVISQKREARTTALEAMRKEAGPAYKPEPARGEKSAGEKPASNSAPSAEKTIGGKTYVKRGDHWFEK